MATQGDITAFDGAATPVSHTFLGMEVGRRSNLLVAMYREGLLAVPIDAQPRLSISRETLRSGMNRFEVRVEVPVLESVAGQNAAGYTAMPRVAYVDTAGMYVLQHPRSQQAGRRNARQLLLNVCRGLATTQTPETTGPAIYAFEYGILPT